MLQRVIWPTLNYRIILSSPGGGGKRSAAWRSTAVSRSAIAATEQERRWANREGEMAMRELQGRRGMRSEYIEQARWGQCSSRSDEDEEYTFWFFNSFFTYFDLWLRAYQLLDNVEPMLNWRRVRQPEHEISARMGMFRFLVLRVTERMLLVEIFMIPWFRLQLDASRFWRKSSISTLAK